MIDVFDARILSASQTPNYFFVMQRFLLIHFWEFSAVVLEAREQKLPKNDCFFLTLLDRLWGEQMQKL